MTDTVRAVRVQRMGSNTARFTQSAVSTEDGVWLIELAPRTIGGKCSRRYLQLGTGTSVGRYRNLERVGSIPRRSNLPPALSGVMMIPVPGPGVSATG